MFPNDEDVIYRGENGKMVKVREPKNPHAKFYLLNSGLWKATIFGFDLTKEFVAKLDTRESDDFQVIENQT